jgi:hypothetical protein
MKKIFTAAAVALFMTTSISAQAPEKMSYQAVVRDASNNLTTNKAVGMQISILQTTATGTAVYVETQKPTTNTNGLVSLEIGIGAVVSGDFTTIDWANGPYFLKTETDPTGGTSYTITGASQLMSVPYALHSNTANSIVGGVNITDVLIRGDNAGANNIVNIGQVTIGSATPTTDAALDINVTNGALLLPRLNNTQQNTLSASKGMIIYNTDNNKFRGYKEGEAVDQQQNTITTCSGGIGQSFTAGSTGLLTAIEVQGCSGSGVLTLKIYDGDGMAGTLLHSETVNLASPTTYKFTLSSPLSIISGQVYTFDFDGPGYSAWYANTNPYAGGKGYINDVPNAAIDWKFKTYLNDSGWIDLN